MAMSQQLQEVVSPAVQTPTAPKYLPHPSKPNASFSKRSTQLHRQYLTPESLPHSIPQSTADNKQAGENVGSDQEEKKEVRDVEVIQLRSPPSPSSEGTHIH